MKWLDTPLQILTLIIFILFATVARSENPSQLTLDRYLDQVKNGNDAYRAANEVREAAERRESEWKLKTRPNLVATYSHVDDYRESGSFQGDETLTRDYSFGIEQPFSFGLTAKLTYNMQHLEIPGLANEISPGVTLGDPRYTTAGPMLELSQSLWRNFLGNEIQAEQAVLSTQAKAQKYSQSFRQTQILTEAESAYWRLALAREAVAANRDSYDRAVHLKKWSAKRRKLELADRSDLLQADSALLGRQLELQKAVDEEKAAARAFNAARGTKSHVVSEQLIAFDADAIDKLQIPERVKFRDDVKAAEQEQLLAEARAKQGLEKNKPTLNLVGAIGYTGRDETRATALDEGWTDENPYYSVGVQFNMPLDLITSYNVRKGYRQEAEAAGLAYRRRVFEQERTWDDLTQEFKDSVGRFKIAIKMEAAQKEKLDYERLRHRRGRTTTYQVIQFEQEYASAQLSRLNAQSEVFNAYAKLKTFQGAP